MGNNSSPFILLHLGNKKMRIVSPGFEPRQRESKSLVLPLHHETTHATDKLRGDFYHNLAALASPKCVLDRKIIIYLCELH